YVGYLGYECKVDCGALTVHRSDVPDAVMMLADRLIAVDHISHRTHLLALSAGEHDAGQAQAWLDRAERCAREAIELPERPDRPRAADGDSDCAAAAPVVFRCGRGRTQYIADIQRCQAELAAGESYEVCLTDQISTSASPDPFTLYKILRARNPAPFAAYLKLGEIAVVSSSPERFLSVDRDRIVQARPIKGTARRSSDPEQDRELHDQLLEDEKTFA